MDELQKNMGYYFRSNALLAQALTHCSYSTAHGLPDNERLEFLGDRVLGMIIADHLFRSCPHFEVGSLNDIQSILEKNKTLAHLARSLKVDQNLKFVPYPNCMEPSEKMLADCIEAMIGAIFLDGGFEAARQFIAKHFHFKSVGPNFLAQTPEASL